MFTSVPSLPSPNLPEGAGAPSLTTIGLCASDAVTARILYPEPAELDAAVTRVEPSRLVLYMVETVRRPRVFAFRTLASPSPDAALVPGVSRGVDLLFATRTRSAAARIRNMLLFFRRKNIDPSQLSDDFWLRLGILLNGRLRRGPHLASLLAGENAA